VQEDGGGRRKRWRGKETRVRFVSSIGQKRL